MDYNIYAGFWYSYNGYWVRWCVIGLLAVVMVFSWCAAFAISIPREGPSAGSGQSRSGAEPTGGDATVSSGGDGGRAKRHVALRWVLFGTGLLSLLAGLISVFYFNGLPGNDMRRMESFYGVQNIVLDKGEAFGKDLVQHVKFTDDSGLHDGKLTIAGDYRTAKLWVSKADYQGTSGEYVKYKPQFAVDGSTGTEKKTNDGQSDGSAAKV